MGLVAFERLFGTMCDTSQSMSRERGELMITMGGEEDVEILLALFDEAIAWMVARGQTGQWGRFRFHRGQPGSRKRSVLPLAEGCGSADSVASLWPRLQSVKLLSMRPPPIAPSSTSSCC